MQWIKCSERMPVPPESGCAAVIVASYHEERKIYHISEAEFQRNNFYNKYNERMSMDDGYWEITHWMPLPPSPVENENEN